MKNFNTCSVDFNYCQTILDRIGNTPLVCLKQKQNIFLKMETFNPTGSIKDRVALYIIDWAEKQGILIRGKSTIIEASSGNQGASIAMIGAIRGYKVIITASDKISTEKKNHIIAYGAELILCESNALFGEKNHYRTVAYDLSQSIENSFFVNQYFSPQNAEAHYYSTGPEIWDNTKGTITHFICGMGSGGTINGVSRFLKEKNPNSIIIGVDSPCSWRGSKKNPRPYQIDGMGVDYESILVDTAFIDNEEYCSDIDAHNAIKELSQTQGLFVGPCTAAVYVVIKRLMDSFEPNSCVVGLCTDSGRSYMSKSYF